MYYAATLLLTPYSLHQELCSHYCQWMICTVCIMNCALTTVSGYMYYAATLLTPYSLHHELCSHFCQWMICTVCIMNCALTTVSG